MNNVGHTGPHTLPPHIITTSHYLVGNIIGDTLPEDRGNQTGVNLFCVKVLVSRVEEEGGGFGTNEVGESLTQHCETENITILQVSVSVSICVCVEGRGGGGEEKRLYPFCCVERLGSKISGK